MSNNLLNDRNLFQRAFLLLLVVFVSVMFFSMVRNFFVTILLAAIFAGLMQPLYAWLSRRPFARRGASLSWSGSSCRTAWRCNFR